jgi:protein-tyrosine phosphatase
MEDRVLAWDGCNNVRDLGRLKTADGRTTRRGVIVRSDTPSRLTAAGWSALYEYGIRTIITLRTTGMVENELDLAPPYADLVVVQAPIEDITDREFALKWAATDLWGTPLYFKDALRRWPEKHAAVISTIARARPGGVLFHCIRGHDRTGIISLLLLTLAGVTPDEIIADYELSVDSGRDKILARENSSVRQAMLDTLEGLDVDGCLREGGASRDDLAAIRTRLVG